MRYKLKHKFSMREKEILITIEDLKYMNECVKKGNCLNGFIFGFEKV